MKLMSFFSNGNEIEIHNNWLGKEIIKYNDEVKSARYSVMGKKHEFSVLENEVWADYVVEIGFANWGIGFNIYRNGEALVECLQKTYFGKKCSTTSEFV